MTQTATFESRRVPPHDPELEDQRLNVNAVALASELHRAIKGEVRFDSGSRGLYSRDGSNYRQIPIGVVVPRDDDDVVETVAACRRFGAPILARGGGTSLAGQCCNVAVVLDFSKYMHNVLEINPDQRWARVQPGTILDHLLKQTEGHNLAFAPDPATHNYCTFGGMIGNNSCGVHSVMAGPKGARTSDNVEEMEILTYDGLRMTVGPTSEDELERIIRAGGRRGEIYRQLRDLRDRYADLIRERYPDIPRRVSGYNLDDLLPENGFNVARALAGSEGTCALFLNAKVTLLPNPPYRALVVLGYPDVYSAADHVPQIRELDPVGLEGLDRILAQYVRKKGLHAKYLKLFPSGDGWLLAEFGGDTQEEANEKAERAAETIRREKNPPEIRVYTDKDEQDKIWEIRESGLGATAFVPGEPATWEGWEDSAVRPDKLGDYLRDLRGLYDEYDYDASLYGHFGQGCVHTRINFDFRTQEGIDKFRSFLHDAADLVIRHGGSFSGEHGDGQARAELLEKMYGPELIQAFREFKAIWDPEWKMNPGKIVDAYSPVTNLALGTDYNPPQVQTHFQYPEDHGSFAHAALRCVGVGKCRRSEGGTMCPSYMVTLEEKHTTRGRARLLYEMMQGDVIKDGWASEEVHDALDLCLACKGCKGDCPVDVDMATYKAEFLSHYFEHHWRPRAAWSMGLVFWWARLASMVPNLVNFAGSAPALSTLVKWVGGVAPQRQMPKFATQTFKEWWFKEHVPQNIGGPQVILWPDTFNNHFHPEIAKAAVEVLEHAGFHIHVPQPFLCCGRPLYDYGFLDLAKMKLQQILDELRPLIRAGVPMIGLEPSCTATFRDELGNLMPHDEDAKRLGRQTFTLGEFLARHAEEYEPPRLERKAIVHGHCHHKSIIGLGGEQDVLDKLGLDYELLDSGCCGMAGSFGFEEEHYDISVACGERALLPAARGAKPDQLLIADGFSCQEQVEQLTNRRPLHLAQVLQMAIRQGPRGPLAPLPEMRYPAARTNGRLRPLERALAIGAGAALVGGVIWAVARKGTNA